MQLTSNCSNVTWNDYELRVWVCVSRAEIYPTFAKTLIQSTRKSMHAHTHTRTQRCEREGELTGRLAGELPAISHTLNSVEFFNKITHLWCLMTPPNAICNHFSQYIYKDIPVIHFFSNCTSNKYFAPHFLTIALQNTARTSVFILFFYSTFSFLLLAHFDFDF